MMRLRTFEIGGLVVACLFSSSVIGAIPSIQHDALTQALNRSIEWSEHVEIEVAKGKRFDAIHLKQEIANLKVWIKEMEKAYVGITVKYPYEKDEGHFIAVKTHRLAAAEYLRNIESAVQLKNVDFRRVRKIAKRMTAEFELAAREHRSELNEMEAQ